MTGRCPLAWLLSCSKPSDDGILERRARELCEPAFHLCRTWGAFLDAMRALIVLAGDGIVEVRT